MIKRHNVMLRDGGSGYRIYVFEESIRRCAIDCKGQRYKEVIVTALAENGSYGRCCGRRRAYVTLT